MFEGLGGVSFHAICFIPKHIFKVQSMKFSVEVLRGGLFGVSSVIDES